MSIYHNGKEYGATKVINYSAAPDYNRGVTVDNIQTGNYQATDNGFLMIQLQSQQSNPTKVSVVRSKTPITNTGTEIASIVISQYQYSETLTAQVMAREYYKLTIDGAGNPQVLSCTFYPYATNVPIKLTEDITMEQVVGLENELDGKQNAGNYATNTELTQGLATKQDAGDYATNTALNDGLATKQDKGNYFNKNTDKLNLSNQVENVLGIINGGTGNATGLNYKNYCGLYKSVCSMLGIENTPRTIQEFWNKMPFGLDITFLATNKSITDLPTTNYYYINITKQDGNLSWITIKSWRSNTTYLAYVADDIVSTWVLVRHSDGTIPAEIISPTVLKYENSDGTWTETKLSDGTTMLEGWGEIRSDASNIKDIFFPKSIKEGVVQATKFNGSKDYAVGASNLGNRLNFRAFTLTGGSNREIYCNWYFRGILA